MLCFFAAFGLAGGGLVIINHGALTAQLDNWQLLPRPERFSELYFTNHQQLPDTVAAGKSHNVAFTVHNLEHQVTVYHYKIIATANNIEEHLANGSTSLAHDQSQTIQQTVILPRLSERIAITVKLEYQSITHKSNPAHWQTQSIHYWVKLIDFPANQKGSHEQTRRDG